MIHSGQKFKVTDHYLSTEDSQFTIYFDDVDKMNEAKTFMEHVEHIAIRKAENRIFNQFSSLKIDLQIFADDIQELVDKF